MASTIDGCAEGHLHVARDRQLAPRHGHGHRSDTDRCPAVRIPPASSLEVVPIDHIRLHEVHDVERAATLVKSIVPDGMQQYLTVLARVGDGHLVHLAGADRIAGLAQLGSRHMAAQLVDYVDSQATVVIIFAPLSKSDVIDALRRHAYSCRPASRTIPSAVVALWA